MFSGGGWSSNYNNGNYGGDTSVVDSCYDGTGRNVCDDAGLSTDNTNAGATSSPTGIPTPEPTKFPSAQPTDSPLITPVTNDDSSGDGDDTLYAVKVATQTIWVSFQNDYADVDTSIEDLMYEVLAAPYLDVTATLDTDGKYTYGPYAASYYYYGYNGSPMVLQQVLYIW